MLALYTSYCLTPRLPAAVFPFGAVPSFMKHSTSANVEHLDYSLIVGAEGTKLVEEIFMGLSLSSELRHVETVMMDASILIASSDLEDSFKDTIVPFLSNFSADSRAASQGLHKLASRIRGAVDTCV